MMGCSGWDGRAGGSKRPAVSAGFLNIDGNTCAPDDESSIEKLVLLISVIVESV
jgi:hypothetical protein